MSLEFSNRVDVLDLSIIIVNYNVKEFLQNLLHSIDKAAQTISTEVIVVDNASDDGSVDFIREKFPGVKLFANDKNLGFSKANNIALKEAKGKYLLLINPDTLVREDTFTKIIEFFETHPEAGLAGCKILNPDGTLQLACRRSFPGPWTSFTKVTGLSALFPRSKMFARYNLTYLDENQTYEVDAISGSFMMFTREVFEKVGGLDERFFMYGEDLDLCYRIQQEGYKVFYVSSTQIIHYKGESTKRSSLDETKFFYNAMHLFVKKHLSTSYLVEFILRVAIAAREFVAFWGKRKLIVLAVLLDFIFFDLSLFSAARYYGSITKWTGFAAYHAPVLYTIPALLHILIASVLGVYKRDSLSVLRNFGAIILSFFFISSLTFFFNQFAYSRAVVIITFLFLLFILTGWRVVLKLFFKVGDSDREYIQTRAIIVGINTHAITLAEKLSNKNSDFHSVLGLISFTHKEIGRKINGFEVLGSIENIKKVIKEKKINEVIFSSEELTYNQMMNIVSSAHDENVEFKLIGSSLDFLVGKTSVSVLDDIPLIGIKYNISDPMFKFFKTVLDYSLASFVLIFIYPFIYLTALMSGRHSAFQNLILNVPKILSGKFSFVGPKEGNVSDLYLGKKGLTGLWYIDESRSNSEKLDIFYAKNQNVWLDLEILGKTLNKMWNSKK